MSGYMRCSAEGFADYLAWEAGEIGDAEHPDPVGFDEYSDPIDCYEE